MVSLIENIVKQVKNEKKREITESIKPNTRKRLLQEKHQRLILESEGEMILSDLESMDENSPNPVLEKLKKHLEMLERKGGKALRDFKIKLNRFKRKINKSTRNADRKIKNFFMKIFN
jgi:hypothetical protein